MKIFTRLFIIQTIVNLFDHFYHLKRPQKQISNLRSENASTLFSRINEKMQRTESATFGETEWERYLAEGKLGLINSISKTWVDTGMKETPEEMIDFLMSFITKL